MNILHTMVVYSILIFFLIIIINSYFNNNFKEGLPDKKIQIPYKFKQPELKTGSLKDYSLLFKDFEKYNNGEQLAMIKERYLKDSDFKICILEKGLCGCLPISAGGRADEHAYIELVQDDIITGKEYSDKTKHPFWCAVRDFNKKDGDDIDKKKIRKKR